MPNKKDLTYIKNLKSFTLGNKAKLSFDLLTPFDFSKFSKDKKYYIIIAEAGPDPVPEFNRGLLPNQ